MSVRPFHVIFELFMKSILIIIPAAKEKTFALLEPRGNTRNGAKNCKKLSKISFDERLRFKLQNQSTKGGTNEE